MNATEDDLRLGLTPELLYEEYIVKNRGLQELADQFSVGVKKIRGALARAGVQKDSKQISAKVSQMMKERIAIHGNNFDSFTAEQLKQAQAASVVVRKANRLQKFADQGLTEQRLRKLYIEENCSLRELQTILDLSKNEVRSILELYGIVKTQADRDLARNANLTSFYESPDKVEAMNLKRHDTVKERYGRSWYRKTTSKEEDGLRDSLQEAYPNLELIQSDWSTIRRVANRAQLQLDLLFPEINLAIEYNGEYYHDRERYNASLRGEKSSPELEKFELCKEVGVRLIHVWSSDWKNDSETVLAMIAKEISNREVEIDWKFSTKLLAA